MPWRKTAADRKRDAEVYGHPEYKRNRLLALRRAGGRCEQCGHRHARLQTDHRIPVTQGGTHKLENLQVLCAGDGTCKCHEAKSAQEGGGYRNRTKTDPAPRPRTNW